MPSAVFTKKSTQKALVQDAEGKPVVVDNAPLPTLGPGDILVRTSMVALNPFDYKMPAASPHKGAVLGNDFVGTIVQIHDDDDDDDEEEDETNETNDNNEDDTDDDDDANHTTNTTTPPSRRLRLGDTVCGAVHGSNAADPTNGAFAEYVRVPADLVLRVPPSGTVSLPDAATLGCALGTAVVALWGEASGEGLQLPIRPTMAPASTASSSSSSPSSDENVPVLVYGGSTASGTMALQLLRLVGAYPRLATCSPRNFDLARAYGATHVYDARDPTTPARIRADLEKGAATNGTVHGHSEGHGHEEGEEDGWELEYALDTITDAQSVACCEAVLSRFGGRLTTLERCPDGLRTRQAVRGGFVMALEVFGRAFDLGLPGYAQPASACAATRRAAGRWFRVFEGLLAEGRLRAHPVRVLAPGLGSVVEGLEVLRSGAVSGCKLVVPLHP